MTSNPFWKEILTYISICGFLQDNISLEPLWYNNRIKVLKKKVFFSQTPLKIRDIILYLTLIIVKEFLLHMRV